MKKTTKNILKYSFAAAVAGSLVLLGAKDYLLEASSHREAPMIANDPLADNTDLYAFRSPDDTNTVTIIANYVPFELPQGGPNYYTFGENVNYEIHIKNDTASSKAAMDDITYRFTFTKTNEDPTTFFDIRLGKQNNKNTYTLQKSTDGGNTWSTIVSDGIVPPPNIGPRSIQGGAGLGAASYNALMIAAITSATGGGGETVFCGPADDPFFVDLGGIFDLGMTRAGGTGVNAPIDGVAKYNVHTIAIKVPIATLQKAGKTTKQAVNILDSDFIIGVWASASRPQISTFNGDGTTTESGNYIQVSRLGMPLTNEAIIPVGQKDAWNSTTPYTENQGMDSLFCNPELELYMPGNPYAGAVPAFANLKIQTNSLGAYNFTNGAAGLSGLAGNPALNGTALAANAYGSYLLRPGQPRSVDLLPIFHTGVPNIPPYQLATGKANGNPLAAGKPFINNFFPNLGDMLRLNMAVPVTPRNSPDFSSLGLVQAAVLGLTDSRFNTSASLQFIPNMDGFPNGRRLEDDVTRIELQAVGGVVLAAIGLWYDDYKPGVTASPVTPDLLGVLGYTTGVNQNDTTLQVSFPYVQTPWSGYGYAGGELVSSESTGITAVVPASGLGIGAPLAMAMAYPNPVVQSTTIKYIVSIPSTISINIYDITGNLVKKVVPPTYTASGTHEAQWDATNAHEGIYLATIYANGTLLQVIKLDVEK